MSVSAWTLTRAAAFASAVFGGALLGSVLQRVVIDTPAWQQLGPQVWADYSRHADLGAGLVVYPIEAIGWTILAVAAALIHRFDHRASHTAGPPLYLTAVLTTGVLAVTAIAAPIMLAVGRPGNDRTALQHAFDQFTFWGLQVRGALIALASSPASGPWPRRSQSPEARRPRRLPGPDMEG